VCGICGIWHLDGTPVSRGAIDRLTDSLAHRGPDGRGVELLDSERLALGHRRLAILDLSPAGRQPLSYLDGRYWITYNGEIYNFVELRYELESLGYPFQTQTDTEVVVAAYDRWGADCQLRFNGMWAFAIWDSRERRLFVSRDRFGIKPFHYLHDRHRFVFASELKAFLHLEGFEPREDSALMSAVLADVFALEGTERTLLQGVRRLVGGHCAYIDERGPRVWRWWRTLDHLVEPPRTLDTQAEHFRELFFDSCRLRLRSDVPVGTSLSGGLDSTSVLCTLARVAAESRAAADERRAADWQRAFVVSFPNTPLDETRHARLAVERAGAIARYVEPDAGLALKRLDDLAYALEEIYITLPIGFWAVYRAQRSEGVVVSLDGHGSDEMLAGYQFQLPTALFGRGLLAALLRPARSLDLARTWFPLWGADGPARRPSLLKTGLAMDRRLGPPLLAARRRLGGRPPKAGTWLRVTAACGDEPVTSAADDDETEAIEALGPLNALLYRHFHGTILPTILRNFDRASMAHGVEVRMPFMDWRLVTYVFSLPDASKVGGGYTKRVLREAMRGIIPEELRLRRDKIGFNSPLPNWLAGPLRDWLWDQVNDPAFLTSEHWDGQAIRQYVTARRGEGGWAWHEGERIWTIMSAWLWERAFLRRGR